MHFFFFSGSGNGLIKQRKLVPTLCVAAGFPWPSCRGRECSSCSSWSRGWDPRRPPCCCVTVTGAHGCSGGGRKAAGVTQPSHSTAFCRGTGDLGLGGTWSWAVSPPRAARPPCVSESRSDGGSAGSPGLPHQVVSALGSPHGDCDSCCPLPVLCTRHLPAPRKPPGNSHSRRKRTSWCCSRFV